MRSLICYMALVLFVSRVSAKTYTVHNEQEFNTASQQIAAGDVILIADGTYAPWAVKVTTGGTAASPVIIKPANAGKVIFSGDVPKAIFHITGDYVILQGIGFTGCNLLKAKSSGSLVEIENAKHSRLTQCTFTKNTAKAQFMPLVIISGNGEHNQADHCSFTGNIDCQDVQVKITKETCPVYTLINNNLFKDKPKVTWKVFNGGECVQVGQDPILLGNMEPKTTVRENQFIHCDGEGEVISNKSSGNRYIKNTFEDCDGELVMRGGHQCLVDSNTITGLNSGIRVNGTGHLITNNTIKNVKTAIRLMYGMSSGRKETGFYVAASDCVVKDNCIENATTGIFTGDAKNEDWTGKFDVNRYPSRTMRDVAPANNQVADNNFVNVTTKTLVQ